MQIQMRKTNGSMKQEMNGTQNSSKRRDQRPATSESDEDDEDDDDYGE